MDIKLVRVSYTKKATFGVLILDGTPFAVTLENPWKNNEKFISCIPEGLYECNSYPSKRFGMTYAIEVPNRSGILFHYGNTEKDTKGCILVGERFGSLKGEPAVLVSRPAFKEFMSVTDGEEFFWIDIVSVK